MSTALRFVRIPLGIFVCPTCGDRWRDEIPPMWTGMSCWPICKGCGVSRSEECPPVLFETPILEQWRGVAAA